MEPVYEFGPFRLDSGRRVLERDGETVPLTSKVFDTLLVLVQHRGELLTKEQLRQAIWPDSFVEESNLTQNISVLRKALGETQGARSYIVTVPGRGYKFVAGVSRPAGSGAEIVFTERVRSWSVTEEEEDTEQALPARVGRRNVAALAAAAMVATAAVAVVAIVILGPPRSPAVTSVAVLPFANPAADPAVAHLSDALAEGLIDRLSQLPGVKVIARNSSFRFRGEDGDPRKVARALGVQAIVTGRVSQPGDRLQTRAELVDANTLTQLWGEDYDRSASDLQAVQEDMARAIAAKLGLRLTGAQERRVAKRLTGNAEAYRLYLAGLFHARKGNREGYLKALDYLDEAVSLDPRFAEAYAAMVPVCANLAGTSGLDPRKALVKGKAAAQRAVELDDLLAQAHGSVAIVKRQEWDWAGAESEFKRAIELNPNLAGVHSAYAIHLLEAGRTAESMTENRRAQELDPLQISFKVNEAGILNAARRHDEALDVLLGVLGMQPDHMFARITLAYTYVAKAMYAEAIHEYEKLIRVHGEMPNGLIDIGYAWARSGSRGRALEVLHRLQSGKQYVSPAGLAILYAGLGEREAAFEALERAWAERDPRLTALRGDYRYDSLRGDPRFPDLARRVGFLQ